MDELLHHCLRELAFDGDLGSDVSRLKDFVVDFYAHTNASHAQNPDDAFCAFVWSLVVQHPTVMIGVVDPGTISKVWIAPQTSAKRKAIARGEDHIEVLPPKLQPIPESKDTPLDILRQTYGDRLRLSVESDAIFAAITGSHIRSSKMSPMVYSALQVITRGRDAGVTVVDLGKLTGYDQKTCFYLVRQLTELDVVMKVRRGGVGTHFCIHKYFFERSSSWKAIRDEETQAENLQVQAQNTEPDIAEEDADIEDINSLNFTPIDARHLSSLPLISGRVIRLLKASKNYIHASNNMLITLGFSNPTKTDRRFFQSRIRDMIQQGLIEKVVVPSNRTKAFNTSVKCFRLVKQDISTPAESSMAATDLEDDMDDVLAQNGIKLNTTIHKQIIDLLEDAGTTGMTLNELSLSLCQFDKRTIELLLARADKSHPPSHLSDLRIVSLMETNGRERRHKYFTIASYQKLLADEQLDNLPEEFRDIDLSNVGGFFPVSEDQFYNTETDLNAHVNSFKGGNTINGSKPKKVPKNPILPDGSVKRGRPRKSDPKGDQQNPDASTKSQQKKKRKLDDMLEPSESTNVVPDESNTEKPSKRPRKGQAESISGAIIPKRRGRPPKQAAPALPQTTESVQIPKKRGRPRKNGAKLPNAVEPDTTAPVSQDHLGNGEDVIQLDRAAAPENLRSSPHSLAPATGAGRDRVVETLVRPEHEAIVETVQLNGATPFHPYDSSSAVGHTELEDHPSAQALASSSNTPTTPSSIPIPSSALGLGRVNVSQLRRENELLRLLESAGGIINIQTKEFYTSHMKLLETLAEAGEPTSAPVGTKLDKRTANATVDSLEQKGKIKRLKTSVASLTGINRPACMVYLPQVDQSNLNNFLAGLSQSQPPASHLTQFVKIDQRVEYGARSPSTVRGIPPLQLLQMEQPGSNEKEKWSKNIERANQLFTYNESTIREVLLAERTTMAQFYGFIVGKALRCRQLHLSMVQALESLNPSSYIVSHEKRVIDSSFFYQDISLELYCSLISPLAYDEEITTFFITDAGRNTLLRDLPSSLQSTLQIGRSRSRTRLLDMFEIMRSLELVTPLEPSSSATPFITCQPNDQHPHAFDPASPGGWTASTSATAPNYWYVHEVAPLRMWAVSETRPPFWKTVSVATHASSLAYWQDLREACNNAKLGSDAELLPDAAPLSASLAAARSIRRTVSWRADYFLSWHQAQYMRQYIDTASVSTPLQIPDWPEREAQITKISWITSAPRDVVKYYFDTIRDKLVKTAEKSKHRAEKLQKRAEETKLSLAKKAEEARFQREHEWFMLLSKIHPEPLSGSASIRMERVKTQFLQSGFGKDVSKWEKEIRHVLHETNIASSKSLRISTKRAPLPRQTLIHSTGVHPVSSEVSIQELIDLQGPPEKYAATKRKTKKEARLESEFSKEKKQPRRHRFQWNSDFDELARDASAIIRARCRNLSRLDWAAFEQVFPSVPRNTVRQRLSHIKETPGNEAYLRRLEDTWYDLWIAHKGTADLPDDNDQSASDFDLIKHVEFLRAHIDKHALRVGLAQTTETATFVIPTSLEQLLESFDVVQAEKTAPEWDFMWNTSIEEGREKKLKRHVLSRCPESFPLLRFTESDDIALAEGTLKMAMGTPPERYDPEQASALLKSRGDEAIKIATKNLLSRGILSKSQRDPQKQGPGRQLKISEINQNAIGGSITRDTYQDAISLLEEIDPNDSSWHGWPLTATDGDCATLIELVSEDKVDFSINTSLPQAARVALDWNSKKTDDDQIETAISVQYRLNAEFHDISFDPPSVDLQADISEVDAEKSLDMEVIHQLNTEGGAACCRKMSAQGLVDCVACLNDAWSSLLESLDPEYQNRVDWIVKAVQQAGPSGIHKNDILALADSHQSEILMIINQMVEAPVPQIYWTGYSSLVLISAHVVAKWSVIVSKEPLVYMFPRRWLDIRGVRVPDFWQAALRAVMGLVVFRPGIPEMEIRWRLRSVYDRQEITDTLRYLHREGYLEQRLGHDPVLYQYAISLPFNDEEESKVFWFIGDKHWYQV